jgi:glucose/arabinose dehydrogenase
MMALDGDGVLHVAERGERRIVRLPDADGDGVADAIVPVSTGLNAPSSIAFAADGALYVGETTRVLRLTDRDAAGVFRASDVIVSGLPEGGHNTRTVLLSADGATLFVSVGSSCNVCDESDPRRAAVVSYTLDGRDERILARGLRNAVGLALRPGATELWVTNNGRDWLGDDQPPETVYIIREGDDAGWPRCHSARIVDPDFGFEGACDGVLAPVVEMQAHTAPLGLTFYTGRRFPAEYQGDLFVALHGSWNRSQPVGYKVVHIPLDDQGSPGPVQDFVSGWLRPDGSQWGRPVDVLTGADGSLFISDDGAGRIYRVFYIGE